jgi:hypothetical protein
MSVASTRLATERINQNVSLSTLHPLEGVKAAGSAHLGGFYRLPIHDHDGGHSERPERMRVSR